MVIKSHEDLKAPGSNQKINKKKQPNDKYNKYIALKYQYKGKKDTEQNLVKNIVIVLKMNLKVKNSDSSNLLESISKLMVTLRMNELILTSKEALPIRRICFKRKSL